MTNDNQQSQNFEQINLGIICPMANERETAEQLVRSVLDKCRGFKSVKFFAILDKSCKDGTFELLQNLKDKPAELNVVWAPEDTCVVDAYIRGYKEVISAGCDWVLEMDAGFSHQPEEIPQFLEKMRQGYDCVFGSRFCSGGQFTDSPFSRRFISRGGSILTNILLGTKLKDMTSGFELFTKDALQKVLDKGINSRGHFFQTEIKTHCRKMRIIEIPIHYRSPSNNVNTGVLLDSFKNLFGLFIKRLTGKL
ncbi:MAG: glycosyltransferase [Phycisphaerales bacterium]|jgi:dolichol-phosphate mannosyltransferase